MNLDLFGEQGSMFSDEELEEISIKIKRFSDEEIINDAYDHFMKHGFPYPNLTLFEMKQEINKLANLELENCLRSTVAYKVADSFHRHRFHSSAINMKSPIESFNIEKNLRKALKMELKGGSIKRHNIPFLNMVNGTQACANFRPAYAKYMYEKYAGENAVVFDSSTGYGGRLTGFLASSCKKYIGVDPNTRTHEANLNLFRTLKNEDKSIRLINLPAEDVDAEKCMIKNVADFSFTSPPYFKKEIYSFEDTQSCNRYEEYQDWIDNFLVPMLQLNFDVVKQGGTTIINIEDVKIKGKTYSLVQPTINAGLKAGFTFDKVEKFALQNRTFLKDGTKVSIESSESVIIFNK
jgi:DNA modification methylase